MDSEKGEVNKNTRNKLYLPEEVEGKLGGNTGRNGVARGGNDTLLEKAVPHDYFYIVIEKDREEDGHNINKKLPHPRKRYGT